MNNSPLSFYENPYRFSRYYKINHIFFKRVAAMWLFFF